MQPTSPRFFYCQTPEDQAAFHLQVAGKIDVDGIVQETPELTNFDESLFELDPSSIEDLRALVNSLTTLPGRCRKIHLGINVSMREIAEATNQAAQTLFQEHIQFIFDGGAIWRFIKPNIERIFTQWSGSDVSKLTPLFQEILNTLDPNDYDWQFALKTNTQHDTNKKLIDQGLVTLLAEKLKKQLFNPYLLDLELAKFKKYAAKQPATSYIHQVFKDRPEEGPLHSDLLKTFIKAFAFAIAADVEDTQRSLSFSLRSISDGQRSHDCLFPLKTTPTTTPINALFLDISSLTHENSNQPIRLKSFIREGALPVLQAISDRNLNLFTFDQTKPADPRDFARIISHFTRGGRCYQKEGLKKMESALRDEAKRQQTPVTTLLAKQLIDRVRLHHGNDPRALIALTFNASALLLWIDDDHKKDLQKMWQVIFTYADSIEEDYFHLSSPPLIKSIQMLMNDPDFEFKDLYAQIQVSASIEQHRISFAKEDISCKTTQTFGHIFTQIKLTLPQPHSKKTYNFLTLFFPNDLPWAIQRLLQINNLHSATKSMLQRIHEIILVHPEKLSFGFQQSLEHVDDPRRELPLCQENISQLLNEPHEQTWFMGYLLALSVIAQKNDDAFLEFFLKNLLSMLRADWASLKLKNEVIDILQRTFNQSNVVFDTMVLKEMISKEPPLSPTIYKTLIKELMTTHLAPFVKIALEHLDEIDKSEDPFSMTALYTSLIKILISKNTPIEQRSLQDLIGRIDAHPFPEETKLNYFLFLYGQPNVVDRLEDELFGHILNALKALPALSQKFYSKTRPAAAKTVVQVLQRNSHSSQSFKILDFVREVFRLQLVDDPEVIKQFWNQTLLLRPKNAKLAYAYLENCLTMAKQFGYWDNLGQSQREAFYNVFIEIIKGCFIEYKDIEKTRMIAQWDSSFNPGKHQELMHHLLNNLVRDKLKEWQTHEISLVDVEIAFALIEQLIRLGATDKDLLRQLFVETSKIEMTSSHINEMRRLITNFKQSQADQNKNLLISFFLSIADEMEARRATTTLANPLYLLALESTFVLLAHPKTEEILNENYTRFIHNLLYSDGPLISSLNKQMDPFLQKLYDQGLWNEIIAIYASPRLKLKHSTINIPICVWACRKFIENHTDDQMPLDNVGGVLEDIPPRLIADKEMKLNVKNIFFSLFTRSFDQKDYSNAQRWLGKEQVYSEYLDDPFYERAFKLFLAAASNGHIKAVYTLMTSLKTPEQYDVRWIELVKVLLKTQQLSTCLSFIRGKRSQLGMKDEKFKETWTSLLNELLEKAYELSAEKDQTKHSLELHELIHELIWHCLPKKAGIWTMYIDLSSRKASLKIVEDILRRLAKQNVLEDSVEPHQQIACWKWLLKRLSQEGSPSIWPIESWLPTAWNTVQQGTKEDKHKLLFYLVQGAVKSFKDQTPEKVMERAKSVMTFLTSEEEKLLLLLRMGNPTAHLHYAKMCIATGKIELLRTAVYAMVETFTMLEYNPIIEAEAVKVMNTCLPEMSKHQDLASVNAMLTLIKLVQQSGHCQEADQFRLLEYLHAIEERSSNDSKLLLNFDELTKRIQNLYLRFKQQVVFQIINNPWKNNRFVSKKERSLLSKTIYQLYWSRTDSIIVDFLKKCLENKNLESYVDSELIHKISDVKRFPSLSWRKRQVIAFTNDFEKLVHATQRHKALIRYGFGKDFHYLKEENEVLDKYGSILCKSLLVTTVTAAGIAIGMFMCNNDLTEL